MRAANYKLSYNVHVPIGYVFFEEKMIEAPSRTIDSHGHRPWFSDSHFVGLTEVSLAAGSRDSRLLEIEVEVSEAASIYESRYPYESEHARNPDEAAEANVALPKVGGRILLFAAECLNTPVIISSDVDELYRAIYPKVIDSLHVHNGLDAAMRVNDLALQIVGDMKSVCGGFKATLKEYMSLSLRRTCQGIAA